MSKYFYDYMTENQDYYSFINESEFDNSQLIELENLIGELREKYGLMLLNNNNAQINLDPIILQISHLFEDVFGFASCQFTVDHSKIPNAYTFAISSRVDMWNYKKCIKKSNKGIKFTPEAKVNMVVFITSGLLFDTKFTNREIVAVLLHEVGHNFSDSINDTLGVFSIIKKILGIPALLNPLNWKNLLNSTRGSLTQFTAYMRKNYPALVTAFNSLKIIKSEIQYVTLSINDVMNLYPGAAASAVVYAFNSLIIQFKKSGTIGFVLDIILGKFKKEDEYISDSFPALYGYGPDLSSALLKLEKHNNTEVRDIIKSSEFGAIWYAIFVESFEYIASLMRISSHPPTAKRLLNILNTLEQELKKDYLNPKFRKATEQEIKEIKKLIEEEEKNHSFEGNYWRVVYNRWLLANAPSYGPKEKAINNTLNKIQGIRTEEG